MRKGLFFAESTHTCVYLYMMDGIRTVNGVVSKKERPLTREERAWYFGDVFERVEKP